MDGMAARMVKARLAAREISSCLSASYSSGPLVTGQTRISRSLGSTLPAGRSAGEVVMVRSAFTPRPYSTMSCSVAAESGAACRRHRGAIPLVAKINAAAGKIVRRHLHNHPVADAGSDAELAHLPRHIGENLVFVVERDAIIAVGEHLGHRAVEFEQLFFGHIFFSDPIVTAPAGRPGRRDDAGRRAWAA